MLLLWAISNLFEKHQVNLDMKICKGSYSFPYCFFFLSVLYPTCSSWMCYKNVEIHFQNLQMTFVGVHIFNSEDLEDRSSESCCGKDFTGIVWKCGSTHGKKEARWGENILTQGTCTWIRSGKSNWLDISYVSLTEETEASFQGDSIFELENYFLYLDIKKMGVQESSISEIWICFMCSFTAHFHTNASSKLEIPFSKWTEFGISRILERLISFLLKNITRVYRFNA